MVDYPLPMLRLKIDVTYNIDIRGSFAVGSGFRRGMLQKTVLRDEKGYPLLPASVLKGRARDAAERFARTLQIPVCENSPHPKQMCGAKTFDELPCLVCRTFGTPGRSSNSEEMGLIWRDAQLVDENDEAVTEAASYLGFYSERTHVQISRRRGMAMEQRLFTEELTKDRLRFKGRVRGWLAVASDQAQKYPKEVLLLLASLKLLNFVGSGKSRGLGLCTVGFHQVDIGEEFNASPDKIFAASEAWIRGLKGAEK